MFPTHGVRCPTVIMSSPVAVQEDVSCSVINQPCHFQLQQWKRAHGAVSAVTSPISQMGKQACGYELTSQGHQAQEDLSRDVNPACPTGHFPRPDSQEGEWLQPGDGCLLTAQEEGRGQAALGWEPRPAPEGLSLWGRQPGEGNPSPAGPGCPFHHRSPDGVPHLQSSEG